MRGGSQAYAGEVQVRVYGGARPGVRGGLPLGYYESALRDSVDTWTTAATDVFLFEHGGTFVVRMPGGQSGSRHVLAESTREDMARMIADGSTLRHTDTASDGPGGRGRRRQPRLRQEEP